MRSRRLAAALLLAMILPGTALQAAVLFDVNDRQTTPGSLVSVPLTTAGFENVTTFQFTLTWDPNVITYSSTADYGLPGLGVGSFNFNPARPDRLTVSWDDLGTPQTRDNGTTLFSVVFNTVGDQGESSTVSFSDDPTPRQVTAGEGAGVPVTFQESPGLVTVVPEPINVALGIFGGVFVAVATFRKLRAARS